MKTKTVKVHGQAPMLFSQWLRNHLQEASAYLAWDGRERGLGTEGEFGRNMLASCAYEIEKLTIAPFSTTISSVSRWEKYFTFPYRCHCHYLPNLNQPNFSRTISSLTRNEWPSSTSLFYLIGFLPIVLLLELFFQVSFILFIRIINYDVLSTWYFKIYFLPSDVSEMYRFCLAVMLRLDGLLAWLIYIWFIDPI